MLRLWRSRKDPAVQPELAIEVAGSEPASASSVVEAAARLLGKAPPSPAALEKEDVLWDWQLAALSEQQYERLGFSAGWQAAIARVLKAARRRLAARCRSCRSSCDAFCSCRSPTAPSHHG